MGTDRIKGCASCGAPTRHARCGLCQFEAARRVPAVVVGQLIAEAEAREVDREQRAAQDRRRRYTVRRMRVVDVVVVQYASHDRAGVHSDR